MEQDSLTPHPFFDSFSATHEHLFLLSGGMAFAFSAIAFWWHKSVKTSWLTLGDQERGFLGDFHCVCVFFCSKVACSAMHDIVTHWCTQHRNPWNSKQATALLPCHTAMVVAVICVHITHKQMVWNEEIWLECQEWMCLDRSQNCWVGCGHQWFHVECQEVIDHGNID